MSAYKTRIAPSPTGHLHLGHALHIMCVQGMAATLGADINLRLEDHDQSRCRPEFVTSILEDLEWLGVTLPTKTWRQSHRTQVYQRHLEELMRKDLIYACSCSRKDVQQTIHQTSGELRYPGTCRNKKIPLSQPNTCLRLKIPSGSVTYFDLLLGHRQENPSEQCGDVVVRDRLGQWTYQFAVVIDDLDQDINLIIRGQDLLASTARQLVIRELISNGRPAPTFAHHPLILSPAGEKLSKRIRSEGLSELRNQGMSADRIRGMAAYLAGLTDNDKELTLTAVPGLFSGQIKQP